MPLQHLNPPGLLNPRAGGSRYTHLVRAGNLVFIAGQVGEDPSGNVVSDDCEAQAERAFRNVETALTSVGATWANVAKLNIYLTRAEDVPAMRRGRAKVMPLEGDVPASTLVVVSALIRPRLKVEVEAVAVLEA